MSLFQQAVNKNSPEKFLQPFLNSFGTACCCNVNDSVYRKMIRLITAHLRSLKHHQKNLIFLLFLKISDNQRQNIMINLKSVLKFPVSPYTMLLTHNTVWRSFCLLFLNIVKWWNWVEIQKSPNSKFSQNCCHWFSQKIWKVKLNFIQLLVVHQVEGM